MNPEKSTTDQKQSNAADVTHRISEKEGIWQQIHQHFQTTQTSLSLRLVCKGKDVQQIGDIKSGVREAARLFGLQDSPQKAEELIASQENLFNRKCQQWEQVAKSAEAQERAKATGGSSGDSASSAANRRKLEAANNAVRNQISNSKQCFRRLRTALNRGVAYGSRKNTDSNAPPMPLTNESIVESVNQNNQPTVPTATGSLLRKPRKSKLVACLQNLIDEGLPLEYRTAPFEDPLCEEEFKSREAIWTERQPYCLIVQWEDSQNSLLNLKFWIVPKRPELVHELRSDDLPKLFLHTKANNEAERLDFELKIHSAQNGPLTSEMTQLLNRIEAQRFLSSESSHKPPLCYLTCSVSTENDFDAAVQQSYLLELL